MNQVSPKQVLQHSAGPIRWMPSGSPTRAIIDRRVYIIDVDTIVELDGATPTRFLDPTLPLHPFEDPVIEALANRYAGLRPLNDGSIWEGLMTAIIGQAVSLHSNAAFQRRLTEMLSPVIEYQGKEFRPLPPAEIVVECTLDQMKSIGVTTRRAQGILDVAREFTRGNIPHPTNDDIDIWMKELCRLPMVGPWTAASTLLWGIGHVDAYPTKDVALLRAAKIAYDDDGMTMKDLDKLSEQWRPQRSIAARLLWTDMLGMGWDD